MTIGHHATHFGGKLIIPWEPKIGILTPATTGYRIHVEHRDSISWTKKFAKFLSDPNVGQVTALVVGFWQEKTTAIVDALVDARTQLPNLTALFIGDIVMEENEMSWIVQTDVSPIFKAYPNLEILRTRGGDHLSIGKVRHKRMKRLIIESGGLDVSVVRDVLAAQLPALEHLELWLGTSEYGGTTKVADLAPLLGGGLFPKLKYLGLRDSEIANDIAVALAQAPILERLEVLDLSLGTLDDTGALALLNHPALVKLKSLDIHHHYCTTTMIDKLKKALQPTNVLLNASEPQLGSGQDTWRFVAVSE